MEALSTTVDWTRCLQFPSHCQFSLTAAALPGLLSPGIISPAERNLHHHPLLLRHQTSGHSPMTPPTSPTLISVAAARLTVASHLFVSLCEAFKDRLAGDVSSSFFSFLATTRIQISCGIQCDPTWSKALRLHSRRDK